MPEIIATPSGTAALCRLFEDAGARVWLPSDICSSVLDGCDAAAIPVRHYRVHRAWKANGDRYELSGVAPGDLVVVSDLFNFRSIHLASFAGMKLVLDLAHCSFPTAGHYLRRFLAENIDIELHGIIFSFGRGKYLRKGGSGCLITNLRTFDVAKIDELMAQLESQFGPTKDYADCDVRGLFRPDEICNSPTSTRMVVRPSDEGTAQSRIEELRRIWKLDISDGLHDYISGQRAPEFYIWKRTLS